jgi:hypothetical protein
VGADEVYVAPAACSTVTLAPPDSSGHFPASDIISGVAKVVSGVAKVISGVTKVVSGRTEMTSVSGAITV